MGREYFCAYHTLLQQLKGLSDAEFGRLIRATLMYSATGELPALSGREAIMLESMAWQVDAQREAYRSVCEKNAANARSRWKKQAAVTDGGSNATVCDRMRSDAVADKKNNIKNIPPISPQGDALEAALVDSGIAEIVSCWEQNIGRSPAAVRELIRDWAAAADAEMVCAVIKYCVVGGHRDGRYIDAVIRNAVSQGITTLKDWEAAQLERQKAPKKPKENEVKRKWL